MLSTATFTADSMKDQRTATINPTVQSDHISSTEQLLHPNLTSVEILSLTNFTTFQTHFANTTKSTIAPFHETTSTAANEFESPTVDATFSNSSSAFDLTQFYSELRELADNLGHQKEDEGFGLQSENSKESSYELLFCPSQPFLARLSLHGQMFEA